MISRSEPLYVRVPSPEREHDLFMAYLAGTPLPPNPENLRWNGRAYGYPECCIEEFVSDFMAGRFSGLLRPQAPDGEHVLCTTCALLAVR